MKKFIAAGVAVLLAAGLMVACSEGSSQTNAQKQAEANAASRENYVPKNDVEGHNYNARQELADNPATLIWCTAFPSSPNAKAFTVPIVGKLTSGNKRPYSTSQAVNGAQSKDVYSPELPGSDGMYGTSGEYRYGFDPAGNYHDFYNLETYCTTVPNVLQRQETIILVGVTGDLTALDGQAEQQLQACRKKDPDPSHPCAGAANLLGVS